jgi:hypothetical protein
MRFSAITIVACIFAVSVAGLPIGERFCYDQNLKQ